MMNHTIGKWVVVAVTIIVLLLLAGSSYGATKYCDLSKATNGTGLSTDPYQRVQALNPANVKPGDTVYVRGKSPVALSFTTATPRGAAGAEVTYRQWHEQPAVVLPGCSFTGPADFYVVLDGPQIVMPDDRSKNSAVTITNSHYVTVRNMPMTGVWKDLMSEGMTWRLVWVRGTSGNITIENNTVSNSYFGVCAEGKVDGPITVQGNRIFRQSGPQIQWDPSNDNCAQLICRGNLCTEQIPAQIVTGSWTHGSGIALWHGNFMVESNVVHNCGNTNGIRSYPDPVTLPVGGYSNGTIQNNLVYDARNGTAVALLALHDKIVVRQNTFISSWRNNITPGPGKPTRYNTALAISLASGADGSGIQVYGNIFGGVFDVPQTNLLTEDYNIFWCWHTGNSVYIQTPRGPHSKILAWGSPSGGSMLPGFAVDALERSQAFFVGGTDFETFTARRPGGSAHKQDLTLSYELADGSLGIGFCGGMPNPTTTDLMGCPRKANDAGCYEYLLASVPLQRVIDWMSRGKK